MSIFSLEWFKSEHKKEKEKLELEEQKLKIKVLEGDIAYNEKWRAEDTHAAPEKVVKPYSSVKLVNSNLTVVLNDGSIISKPNATAEDFKKVRECQFEEQIFTIVSAPESLVQKKKEEQEIVKIKTAQQGLEILSKLDDFEVKDNAVYMKGINRSLPLLLVEKFVSLVDKGPSKTGEYEAIKKFWLKCCLNPNAQSAEDLYEFLTHHQFKIDKHGNFYAYRRVVSTTKANKELVEFVSNAYNKVKAVWKKKPIDFEIWRKSPFDSGDFLLHKIGTSKIVDEGEAATKYGNLQDLYLDLPNMQEKSYTDAHTHTMDYRIGQASSIPRNDGDDDNSVSCSRGLHIASKAYDYSGFGNTPILAIINPMDVLAVPKGEVGKLRTCRWFFATVLPEDEKYILDDEDFDVSELGDVFEEQCLENIEAYVKGSFAEEVKRHTFTLSSISSSEVHKIALSLQEMKDSISGRVVENCNAYSDF